jgi:hypothetical protein
MCIQQMRKIREYTKTWMQQACTKDSTSFSCRNSKALLREWQVLEEGTKHAGTNIL